MLIALPSTSTTREPLAFAFATYHQTLSSVCSYEMMLLRGSYHYDFLVLHNFVFIVVKYKYWNVKYLQIIRLKKFTRQALYGRLSSIMSSNTGRLAGRLFKGPKTQLQWKRNRVLWIPVKTNEPNKRKQMERFSEAISSSGATGTLHSGPHTPLHTTLCRNIQVQKQIHMQIHILIQTQIQTEIQMQIQTQIQMQRKIKTDV